MLSKDDLKQIRAIVREEVEAEVENAKNELTNETKFSRMQVLNRIDKLEDRMKNLEVKFNKQQKELEDARKDIGIVISTFDQDYMKLKERVEVLEDHLGYTQS